MRVLIHMGDPYPNEGPNAKRMRTFYEAFRDAGHEVCVLAPESSGSDTRMDGVIGFKNVPLKSKSSLNRLMNQFSIGFNSVKAAKKFGKADVVITTSPPALISIFGKKIARKSKAKLVYDVRDIWPDVAWEMGSFSPKSLYSRVFEWNRNHMLSRSDLVTTVSHGKVEKLQGYCSKTEVIYITNGLDEKFLNNYDNDALIKKYKLDEVFTCVYIGNLGLAQGLTQLLSVAKKAKERQMPVRFLLFGSGVEEQKLKDFAAENKLDNVLFPGRLPNADMYTVLNHSGMSFVSLVNEKLTDSVPTKLYEALGVGCPVLLAAAGESVEILNESKLGLAVKPNDEEALWKAFVTLYEQRESFLQRKEYARSVILEKYSRQKAAKLMVEEITKRFEKKK